MVERLFLDDERFPPEQGEWTIVRSFAEAVAHVESHGIPHFMSFDHDLGDGPDGCDVVHWMIEQHLDGKYLFPDDFGYVVHSMNPIGGGNISALLDSFCYHVLAPK